jgi:hypothetical protein
MQKFYRSEDIMNRIYANPFIKYPKKWMYAERTPRTHPFSAGAVFFLQRNLSSQAESVGRKGRHIL